MRTGGELSSSFWAGLGGFQSASVEQAGVESACQGGRPTYWAWWEEAGGATSSGLLSRVLVHPGNTITATVVDLGGDRFAMAVTDATSNTTQSATASEAGSDDDSVECIAEDPSGSDNQVPYTDYGDVAFSSCLAGGISSHLGTIVSGGSPVGAGRLVQISGVTDGNGVDAAVSPMTNDTSFTVTREFPPVYTPPLADPVVGIASMPDGAGYWLVNGAGAVSAHGAAQLYGSMAGHPLVSPVAHIISSPTGHGYWMVAADGGVFSFGDAGFYGSMGGQHLNMPVVSMAPAPGGHGYWLVASDGGVFAFGAPFDGSMGGQPLNKPMVGIALDPVTGGYWLVAVRGRSVRIRLPLPRLDRGHGRAAPRPLARRHRRREWLPVHLRQRRDVLLRRCRHLQWTCRGHLRQPHHGHGRGLGDRRLLAADRRRDGDSLRRHLVRQLLSSPVPPVRFGSGSESGDVWAEELHSCRCELEGDPGQPGQEATAAKSPMQDVHQSSLEPDLVDQQAVEFCQLGAQRLPSQGAQLVFGIGATGVAPVKGGE